MLRISPAAAIVALFLVLGSPAVAAPDTVTFRSDAPPGPLTFPCDRMGAVRSTRIRGSSRSSLPN